MLVSHRAFEMPLNTEEFYYEQTCAGSSSHNSTSEQLRRGAWRIVVAGGSVATGNTATYTGGSNLYDPCGLPGDGVSQMRHLYDFWTNGTPFWQMEPRNDLADNGATCRAKTNDTYVCYQEGGVAFALDLSAATGTFSARRFDPRTGAFSSLGNVSGGAPTVFTPPDADDWIFLVQRPG